MHHTLIPWLYSGSTSALEQFLLCKWPNLFAALGQLFMVSSTRQVPIHTSTNTHLLLHTHMHTPTSYTHALARPQQ